MRYPTDVKYGISLEEAEKRGLSPEVTIEIQSGREFDFPSWELSEAWWGLIDRDHPRPYWPRSPGCGCMYYEACPHLTAGQKQTISLCWRLWKRM